ncbi:Uu.00g069420.m01.CDS01 [Anthostomella pinea]|uniref:Uu.00g069420.m01.CDS01 n=1 Tax=Anthostomella pinea TaxID=933095 RepID=A0AAI8VUH4_9PEZI|nr:Uu.00g069420.m01.CDS01 [Anthostomella pinea]
MVAPIQHEALAEHIEAILRNPEAMKDERLRRRLSEGGRKLGITLEDSGATLRRVGYAHFQSALARTGIEAGVFAVLEAELDRQFTNGELAEKTGVDPKLSKRLLRYFQSQDIVSQPSVDGYRTNNVTRVLGSSGYGTSLLFFVKVMAPAVMAIPDFLKKQGYKDPNGVTPGAFHLGHRTDMHPFAWREGRPSVFDVVDFENDLARGATSSTPLFVDVGGATGSQCVAFRRRYSNLVGRVILQDVPQVVEQVMAHPLDGFENIEVEAQNFLTPETVKGGRAYYFRNVLHEWPDEKVVEILVNVKTSMADESVILIDEAVLSERGCPWRAAQQDMEILAAFSAYERTEAEWRSLVEDAGLMVRDVRKYTEEYEDTVIVVGLT